MKKQVSWTLNTWTNSIEENRYFPQLALYYAPIAALLFHYQIETETLEALSCLHYTWK